MMKLTTPNTTCSHKSVLGSEDSQKWKEFSYLLLKQNSPGMPSKTLDKDKHSTPFTGLEALPLVSSVQRMGTTCTDSYRHLTQLEQMNLKLPYSSMKESSKEFNIQSYVFLSKTLKIISEAYQLMGVLCPVQIKAHSTNCFNLWGLQKERHQLVNCAQLPLRNFCTRSLAIQFSSSFFIRQQHGHQRI